MKGAAALFAALVAMPACAQGIDVGRYHLQSNPWVNLHQRLLYESRFTDAPPMALDARQAATWTQALEAYRGFVAKRDPIVDRELVALNDALSRDWGARPPDSIPAAASRALEDAMPVYRAAQWERDDRVNRFWIEMAVPMVASAGEELAQGATNAYGVPFPEHIRVDACSFGWEFGAYTDDNAHTVIAAGEPGNQGFAALEALVHEPSHAIVAPASGAIGADLAKAARELGLRPPASLWHAILFYTAGELTRRALAERGVSRYHRVVEDMYARGFQRYRHALETYWQGYLDGKLSRGEAVREILRETAPPR